MKVLIADDSATSRILLRSALLRWGYEVVMAENGAQAWEILAESDCPPMAILDWVMPHMTGPEVCRRVRENHREPYTYILLLTSKNTKNETVEGLEAGADDYIVKPFDEHELQVRLRAGKRIVDLQMDLVTAREELRERANKDLLTLLPFCSISTISRRSTIPTATLPGTLSSARPPHGCGTTCARTIKSAAMAVRSFSSFCQTATSLRPRNRPSACVSD
jgi:CheY-like chemotaxis protein